MSGIFDEAFARARRRVGADNRPRSSLCIGMMLCASPLRRGFSTLLRWVLRDALQLVARAARELRSTIVVTTIRFCYDATIAVALTSVFALAVALIAAVIGGGDAPNVSVAIIAFALTGTIVLFRWRRGWLRSAARPAG